MTVSGLLPGKYTLKALQAPPDYGLVDPVEAELTLSDGTETSHTIVVKAVAALSPTGFGTGGWVSWAVVGALFVWAIYSGLHGWSAQVMAAIVTGVGLALVALIGGRYRGFFSPLIGGDGRASTSKTSVALWTVVLLWGLAYLLGEVIYDNANLDTVIPQLQLDDYLILLGGPFAAAVIAKGAVSYKMSNGSLQKTVDSDSTTASAGKLFGDLFKNDKDSADLVDTQYLLFNLLALAYFVLAFRKDSPAVLPAMPPVLLGLTGSAAALYSGNKVVEANKPSVTGVSPATARPGDTVKITGTNFRPAGTGDSDEVFVTLEGFGPLTVGPPRSDSEVNIVIPPGAPLGLKNLLVTTAAGVAVDPRPIQIEADAPAVTAADPPQLVSLQPVVFTGRRFRSASTPNAAELTVWFDQAPVLGTIISGGDAATDQVSVTVPALTSGQVNVSLQSASGARSSVVTFPVVLSPIFSGPASVVKTGAGVDVTVALQNFLDANGNQTAANAVVVDGGRPHFQASRTAGIDTVVFSVSPAAGTTAITLVAIAANGQSSQPQTVQLP